MNACQKRVIANLGKIECMAWSKSWEMALRILLTLNQNLLARERKYKIENEEMMPGRMFGGGHHSPSEEYDWLQLIWMMTGL